MTAIPNSFPRTEHRQQTGLVSIFPFDLFKPNIYPITDRLEKITDDFNKTAGDLARTAKNRISPSQLLQVFKNRRVQIPYREGHFTNGPSSFSNVSIEFLSTASTRFRAQGLANIATLLEDACDVIGGINRVDYYVRQADKMGKIDERYGPTMKNAQDSLKDLDNAFTRYKAGLATFK